MSEALTGKIAERLKQLRLERGWPLDRLAALTGVSRATLSRLENAEVSPTTDVLARLCSAFGFSLTRLMMMVEEGFPPLVRAADQPVWRDKDAGFTRRSLSPPAGNLSAEMLRCRIEPGHEISYEAPSRPGMEHHLALLEGELEITLEDETHCLTPGDCLRYKLTGTSRFRTGPVSGADYILILI